MERRREKVMEMSFLETKPDTFSRETEIMESTPFRRLIQNVLEDFFMDFRCLRTLHGTVTRCITRVLLILISSSYEGVFRLLVIRYILSANRIKTSESVWFVFRISRWLWRGRGQTGRGAISVSQSDMGHFSEFSVSQPKGECAIRLFLRFFAFLWGVHLCVRSVALENTVAELLDLPFSPNLQSV